VRNGHGAYPFRISVEVSGRPSGTHMTKSETAYLEEGPKHRSSKTLPESSPPSLSIKPKRGGSSRESASVKLFTKVVEPFLQWRIFPAHLSSHQLSANDDVWWRPTHVTKYPLVPFVVRLPEMMYVFVALEAMAGLEARSEPQRSQHRRRYVDSSLDSPVDGIR